MLGSSVFGLSLLVQAAAAGSGGGRPSRLQEYTVDAGHSIVEFSIGFALTRIKGRFIQWQGTILYDSIAPDNFSVTAVIESKSIDTGWPHRDQHLRTSDFFDVERFPTITFRSARLRRAEGGWIADGSLTMHGVTRPVSLPFRFLASSPSRSPESRNMMLDLEGSLRLARADFGIVGGSKYNSWFTQARSATMSDSVDIAFEVEGWRADAASQRPPGIEAALQRITTSGIGAHLDRLREQRSNVTEADWPKYFRGQDFLVHALVDSDRKRDALELAKALPDLFSQSANSYLMLGYAASSTGDSKTAATAYARAKEVYTPPARDPNEQFPQVDDNWHYMDLLARTTLEAGRVPQALPLARVLTELYPDIARAHSRYAQALALARQYEQSAATFAKALQVDSLETRALEYRRRLLR